MSFIFQADYLSYQRKQHQKQLNNKKHNYLFLILLNSIIIFLIISILKQNNIKTRWNTYKKRTKYSVAHPNKNFPNHTTSNFQDSITQNRAKHNFKVISSKHQNTPGIVFYPVLLIITLESLLLQFRRLANVYFIFIATLQTIPIISPLIPVTAWIPISVVLSISIMREGYQDFQRYKSDKQMNHEMKTQVHRQGKFQTIQWCQILIGDVCKIMQNQLIAADMILLGSSNEGGGAFIQTASLDGQKNLKPRNSMKQTIKYMNSQQSINKFQGQWKGIIPNKDMHQFSSNMILDGRTIVYQGDKQLLYRGARLKNTKYAYGLVIYTGRNTKILMNSQGSTQKMSQIQKKVNRILIFILIFQIILCTVIATLYGTQSKQTRRHTPYIDVKSLNSIMVDSVIIFFSYFILINSMIPISLVVSMQFVKLFQSYFIKKDNLMYSEYRKKGVDVRMSSLNQELGQIQYVFTDKTGTLTTNVMEFKIALVGNIMYGSNSAHEEKGFNSNFKDQRFKKLINENYDNFQLTTPIIVQDQKPYKISTQRQLCQQYLFALSTAHEVVAEHDQKGNLKYEGPSPDQVTLVKAAKQMGFQFVKSNNFSTTVKIRGKQKTYQLLQVIPFNSDRKRMSVIIQDQGVIKMYTKGADNIILQRLSQRSKLDLSKQLTQFSKEGLRTLLIAMKIISKQQYVQFRKKVQKLPQTNREQIYEKLVSDLERNLYIIGATAVLDRLQDFVPQTIKDLIRANIKVWMLTGDKMQTAQNIAKNCHLFQRQFTILKFKPIGKYNVVQNLNQLVIEARRLSQCRAPKGLIIQGSDLSYILMSDEGKKLLADLANECQAVVCCRLLPLQKAQVVSLVRNQLQKITLAIGDGANDVSMIKASHIGIGLYGEEGMSAVQASDYALPQFRMLWRLLFVHGRWNYIRISQMILYFFFKNVLFTFPQFIVAFFCSFSGQSIFDDWYLSFYNLIFTSIPLVVRAVLQQDVNYIVKKSHKKQQQQSHNPCIVNNHRQNAAIQRQSKYLPPGFEINKYFYRLFPKIYFIGQQNCVFNYKNFFFWIVEALVQATMIALISLYIMGVGTVNSHGVSNSLWLVGLTIYTSVICIVTFKICAHTKFISKIFLFSVLFLSLGLYIAYMWISNYFFTNNIAGTTKIFFISPKSYLCVLFCSCVVLFVDGVVLHIDFSRGGYASKMRQVLSQNMVQDKNYYEVVSLKITTEMMSQNQNANCQQQDEDYKIRVSSGGLKNFDIK